MTPAVADLYLIIFNLALSPSSAPAKFQHGRSGIYFTISEEHQLYDVSKAVAVGLARRGIGSPESTPFSKTEPEPLLYAFGTRSSFDYAKSRGKALRGKPTKGTAFVEFDADRQLRLEYYSEMCIRTVCNILPKSRVRYVYAMVECSWMRLRRRSKQGHHHQVLIWLIQSPCSCLFLGWLSRISKMTPS